MKFTPPPIIMVISYLKSATWYIQWNQRRQLMEMKSCFKWIKQMIINEDCSKYLHLKYEKWIKVHRINNTYDIVVLVHSTFFGKAWQNHSSKTSSSSNMASNSSVRPCSMLSMSLRTSSSFFFLKIEFKKHQNKTLNQIKSICKEKHFLKDNGSNTCCLWVRIKFSYHHIIKKSFWWWVCLVKSLNDKNGFTRPVVTCLLLLLTHFTGVIYSQVLRYFLTSC